MKYGTDKVINVSNNHLSATFESDTGLLTELSCTGGKKHNMNIRFMQYGTVHFIDRSGAYLFLPSGEASVCIICMFSSDSNSNVYFDGLYELRLA